jgi:outer membrane protein insertion porin family
MKQRYIFTTILCFAFVFNVFGEEAAVTSRTSVTESSVASSASATAVDTELVETANIETSTVETTFMNYNNPRMFEIGGITVMGTTALDPRSIMLTSGLEIGDRLTLPGEKIASAIDRLWRLNIFGNIEIYATHIVENKIFLVIEMEELPRIASFEVTGVRKFLANKLSEELGVNPNDVLTENRLNRLRRQAINFYKEKGFLNAEVTPIQKFDTATGGINLTFEVNRGQRVKISEIEIIGNEALRTDNPDESFRAFKQAWRWTFGGEDLAFSDARIKRNLKNTKEKNYFRFWKRSKFVEPDFREDLKALTARYNNNGFRDFRVIHDSLTVINDSRVKLTIQLTEGNTYYFGNIDFVGNTKYSDEVLSMILNIKRGDVYNDEKLQQNLSFNPKQVDITSLYMDDGYLTFMVIPVETRIENDTVDIEIRMREGKQARINRVGIQGNNRTNDYVIIRELRVLPGQLFSRSNIINSMNELRMMRYFDDATINPDVQTPNIEDGLADVIFQVQEIGSDQVELSGGWGGGMVVGTLGFSFNNFSIQNIFRKDRWRPLPSGDGQRLTLRGQSNGSAFHSISMSYMEPWFGGRKPYSLSISAYTTMQSNGMRRGTSARGEMVTTGLSLGLGQRLRVPDMFFTLFQSFNYQHYNTRNFGNFFPVQDGIYHNFSYTVSLGRQNLDGAIYPKNGSSFNVSLQATPPYSLLNGKTYPMTAPDPLPEGYKSAQQYLDNHEFQWLEFYKWNFKADWYLNPFGNFVIAPRMRFGAIGRYNDQVRYTPFERFKLGGDGMAMFSFAGVEIIGMRGYTNESLSHDDGALAFNKLTLEIRQPLTLNPAASIWALAFVEAGNSWVNPRQINPFQNYRSAGIGVRLFLSAMGMFGLDWGYGFDAVPGKPSANRGQFHFSINQGLD